MKILLVCVHFHSSFGWSIEQALKRQGHDVRIFEYRTAPMPFRLRMRRLWTDVVMPRQLIQTARSLRPDLLWIAKGETLRGETLETIRREQGCRMINWFPDTRLFGYPRVVEQLPALDFFFSKTLSDVKRSRLLGLANGRFLQHCADRDLHVELETSDEELKPYRSQVSVVGSYYPYRDRIVQTLCDFDLRVWGPGWEASGLYRRKPEAVMRRDARSFEQAKVFRATDVNLNPHHFDDIDDLNQRVFDIAGSGGCQVTDGFRDLGPIFGVPGDIATFRSSEEMREVIRFLLDHPNVRQEMSESCRRKVAAGHTYDHRAREILDALGLA